MHERKVVLENGCFDFGSLYVDQRLKVFCSRDLNNNYNIDMSHLIQRKYWFTNISFVIHMCDFSFSSHASNLLLTTPSAPTTTGTQASRCRIPHSLLRSLFRSCYFSIFLPSFSYYETPGRKCIHYDCLAIFLLKNNNVGSSGLDNIVTLDGHIHRILHFSYTLY